MFLLLSTTFVSAQQQKMEQVINENLAAAVQQYKTLALATTDSVLPRSFDAASGKYVTSDPTWWCSGFYPGTLWYLYEFSKDETIKQEAEKRLAILEPIQYFTENHDLGFMMYCSFGNAYRLTNKPSYKDIILNAANSLATRFRPSINAIQSWNANSRLSCPVIIDNMMNLELLYWAADHGGDSRLKEIALTHSNTTINNHFRDDYSSYHVVDYDIATGGILKKITWQGAADSSAWARGQSWGLYGYTLMYRFSHDKRYLEQAKNIADFLIHHPNLPADKIPYWDYNATNIPATYKDASAGAIMASALLELAQYTAKKESKNYIDVAVTILRSLSSPTYRAVNGECGGFLIKHNVGSLPHKSELDVSLSYADYYYVEALLRYKNWYLKK